MSPFNCQRASTSHFYAMLSVFCVQRVGDCSYQLDRCWVRSLGRFVFVSEFLEESSEKGMVFFASFQEFLGIFSTQVGDPLAHRQEGRAHAASFDGLSTPSRPAVSETEHEEVAEFCFRVHHFPQGWVDLSGSRADPELDLEINHLVAVQIKLSIIL